MFFISFPIFCVGFLAMGNYIPVIVAQISLALISLLSFYWLYILFIYLAKFLNLFNRKPRKAAG